MGRGIGRGFYTHPSGRLFPAGARASRPPSVLPPQRQARRLRYTAAGALGAARRELEQPAMIGMFRAPEMDASRRSTLEALVDLAKDTDADACWDHTRAENLLRTQSTEEELRSIDIDPQLIARLWPKDE